eukprot:SAG22_NODE_3699_length_1569_cov_1.721769_1_plen_355_part_00
MVFPVLNIYNVVTGPDPMPPPKASSAAGAWYMDLPARYLRTTTYLGLALFAYSYTFPLDQAATFSYDWMLLVLARNLAIGYTLYGGWHHFLYESRFSGKMRPRKFNQVMPKGWQRDRFWTTVAFCIESAVEVGMMHLWATGKAPMYASFWEYPAWSVGWMLFIPYWHDFHFWFIHRLIHIEPLYKYIHSLHHKSYNPGPWSGMSMHPVETAMYFSSCLFPFLWLSQHPVHFLFKKFYTSVRAQRKSRTVRTWGHILLPCSPPQTLTWCAVRTFTHTHTYTQMSPIGGHDGFDQPGGGSFIHYLHHAHFNCNYGTSMVPLDKLFGCYEDGTNVGARARLAKSLKAAGGGEKSEAK